MHSRIDIIRTLLKASRSEEIIEVVVRGGAVYSGKVESFDGTETVLDGRVIRVEDIVSLTEYAEKQKRMLDKLQQCMGRRVFLTVGQKDGSRMEIDGVLLSIEEDILQVVTDLTAEGLMEISLSALVSVTEYREAREHGGALNASASAGAGEPKAEPGESRAERIESGESKNEPEEPKAEAEAGEPKAERAASEEPKAESEEPKSEPQAAPESKTEPESGPAAAEGAQEPDDFEKALIAADVKRVGAYIEHPDWLAELGYTEREIDIIRKTVKLTNWNKTNYDTGCRLRQFLPSRNGLPEKYFVLALEETAPTDVRYTKILNQLAIIYSVTDKEKFVSFFQKYRKRLIQNSNYYKRYMSSLRQLGRWNEVKVELPKFEEKFAGEEAVIKGYRDYVKYMQYAHKVDVHSLSGVCWEEREDPEYDEAACLRRLPEREAYKELLAYYEKTERYEAYFSVASVFLFDLINDYQLMKSLEQILGKVGEEFPVVYADMLNRLPVFWCNEKMVRMVLKMQRSGGDVPGLVSESLLKQAEVVKDYETLNQFEMCIVNGDYESMKELLKDNSILEEMGYTEEEIQGIREINLDEYALEGSKRTTLRRILDFQKNKNNAAERYLFEGIYESFADTCSRMFPLLIQESRGEFVAALYEFVQPMGLGLSSLERYYLLGLSESADDEKFWDVLKERWTKCKEEAVLKRLLQIAGEKGEVELARQVEIQLRQRNLSSFERALIADNIGKIREIVSQPEQLAEAGYTPDEIARVQDMLTKPYVHGTGDIQIARRVYVFQKNKNMLAQTYYEQALRAEALPAAKALLEIYAEGKNWEKIIEIYEQYLAEEMEEQFNRTYGIVYSNALFQTKRYQDLFRYWKQHYDADESYPYYPQLLYAMEKEGITEKLDLVYERISRGKVKADAVYEVIMLLLERDLAEVKDQICTLYNAVFSHMALEKLYTLSQALEMEKNLDVLDSLKGTGLRSLVQESDRLPEWYEYLAEPMSQYERMEFLGKLVDTYPGSAHRFVDETLRMYREIMETGDTINTITLLFDVLQRVLARPEDREKWIGIVREAAKIDVRALRLCWKYCSEQKDMDTMLPLFEKACEQIKDEAGQAGVVAVGLEMCAFLLDSPQVETEKLYGFCERLEQVWGSSQVNVNDCMCLLQLYRRIDAEKACMLILALRDSLWWMLSSSQWLDEFTKQEEELLGDKGYTLEYFLIRQLDSPGIRKIDHFLNFWSKFFKFESVDQDWIQTIYRQSEHPEQWDERAVNALVKALLCEEVKFHYWVLLEKRAFLWTAQARCNIKYHICVLENQSLRDVIYFAVEEGLKDTAFQLILENMRPDNLGMTRDSQKMLYTIKARTNWYEEEDPENYALQILKKMSVYEAQGTTDAWRNDIAVMDFAFWTGRIREFMDIYGGILQGGKPDQCSMLVCRLIMERPGEQELLRQALELFGHNFREAFYGAIVMKLAQTALSRPLDRSEETLLLFTMKHQGSLVGVEGIQEYYFDCVLDDRVAEGIMAAEALLKEFPEDAILYELLAWLLLDAETDEEIEKLYLANFEYVRRGISDNMLDLFARPMILGEYYLRRCERNVPSIEEYCNEKKLQTMNTINSVAAFCKNVERETVGTPYEELGKILLKTLFCSRWDDLFLYLPADKKVERYLDRWKTFSMFSKTPDLELMRGIVGFYLRQGEDKLRQCSSRIAHIWKCIPVMACSFEEYRDILLGLTQKQKETIAPFMRCHFEYMPIQKNRIFIERLLSCPGSEELAVLFTPLGSKSRQGLFDVDACKEILGRIPEQRRAQIAKAYNLQVGELLVPLQIQGQEADAAFEMCRPYRERYLKVMEQYGLRDRTGMKNLTKGQKDEVSTAAGRYYFMIVIHESKQDLLNFTNIPGADLANALAVASQDEQYSEMVERFINTHTGDNRLACICVVMILQGRLEEAYERIAGIRDLHIRNVMYFRLAISCRGVNQNLEAEVKKNLTVLVRAHLLKFESCCPRFRRIDAEGMAEARLSRDEGQKPGEDGPKKPADRLPGEQESAEQRTPAPAPADTNARRQMERYCALDFMQRLQQEFPMEAAPEYQRLPENVEQLPYEQACKLLLSNWYYMKEHPEETAGADGSQARRLCRSLGLVFLHRQKKMDIPTFLCVLELIDGRDDPGRSVINLLIENYINYFEAFDTLDDMCLDYQDHIDVLKSVELIKKKRSNERIDKLIEILVLMNQVAEDVLYLIDSRELKRRLDEYYSRLTGISTRLDVSKIQMKLKALIGQKIASVNSHPELKIAIDGGYANSQVWKIGKIEGSLSGYVKNSGKIAARRVYLRVRVNYENTDNFYLDAIYPDESIPFRVYVELGDISNDGNISWSVELQYNEDCEDEDEEPRTESVECKTKVVFGDKQVNLGRLEWQHKARGKDFVGRDREMNILNTVYADIRRGGSLPSMLVMGLRRLGKSTILVNFLDRSCGREDILVLDVDAQGTGGDPADAFIRKVLVSAENYKSEISGDFDRFMEKWERISHEDNWMPELPNFYHKLSELCGGRKLLILFDEMESIFYGGVFRSMEEEERFYGILRSIIQDPDNDAAFIFCGSDKLLSSCLANRRESQLFQNLQRMVVGRMDYHDIQTIFKNYSDDCDVKFTREAIELLWKYTNGQVWYTKLLGSAVLTEILAGEQTGRCSVFTADIQDVVEMLLEGDLGRDKYDILVINLEPEQRAVLRAMAECMPDYNDYIGLGRIVRSLESMVSRGYRDNRSGELLSLMSEEEVQGALELLTKMQFVEQDKQKKNSYAFATELYRLIILDGEGMRKFERLEED